MTPDELNDLVIIGGGIIGTSTAMSLLSKKDLNVTIIEAENKLAAHQTGNNSGVIHSGLYYKPGSLKAENCIKGREMMYDFCERNSIKHDKCGKIVVAVSEEELPALNELERRGKANGLTGLKRLKKEELKEYEPHVNGIEGLLVPETGIVDYKQVTDTYAKIIEEKGGRIIKNCRFLSLKEYPEHLVLRTTCGEIKAKFLVNCAGLRSDLVAKLCGVEPNLQIVPFRGEYYKLKKEKEHLVKNLIYPVPDPKFPFLGVHFTRMIEGGVEAGPNAVLAFKREGYKHSDISVPDVLRMAGYSGFWHMAAKHYKMGFHEFHRSLSKSAFVNALRKLIPEIEADDIYPGGAGVRAQALESDGKLVDDFRILESKNMIHVLNAPSPAATASLSIGETIASKVLKSFEY